MTGLIVAFVLLWFALMALLFSASWLQGYIYSEPEAGMIWRAPVAGTALVLIPALWAFIDYRSIKTPNQTAGTYTSLFNFSPDETKEYSEIWAMQAGEPVHYGRQRSPTGQPEFRDAKRQRMPMRVDTIIVMENEEKIPFNADKDAQGNFKSEMGRPLRYVDPRGRVMTEDNPGEVTTVRSGVVFGYLLLNFLHFAAWFVCLWLILRFQWQHALGLAVVFWLVMTLLIMPLLLDRAEEVARDRVKVQSESTAAR